MRIRSLPIDYDKLIKKKKDFFLELKEWGINTNLIRKAIHHMPLPPYECHEIFFKKPHINVIKGDSPDEYSAIDNARKALVLLLSSPIPTDAEKESFKAIHHRIIIDYEIGLTDRKALLDSFRSEREIIKIEDYADYPEEGFLRLIDKDLNTQQQCEGKLITMLYEYIKPSVDDINEGKPIGHQNDYNQKDIFELIAEILNLRWHKKYNYEKIRTIYRNFQAVKS